MGLFTEQHAEAAKLWHAVEIAAQRPILSKTEALRMIATGLKCYFSAGGTLDELPAELLKEILSDTLPRTNNSGRQTNPVQGGRNPGNP